MTTTARSCRLRQRRRAPYVVGISAHLSIRHTHYPSCSRSTAPSISINRPTSFRPSHVNNHGVHGAVAKRQRLSIPHTPAPRTGCALRSSKRRPRPPQHLCVSPQAFDRDFVDLASDKRHAGKPPCAQERDGPDAAHTAKQRPRRNCRKRTGQASNQGAYSARAIRRFTLFRHTAAI